MKLDDGTGAGYSVKVNKNKEAHVYAVTTTNAEYANDQGDAYNINTGLITLTNAVDTPVLYIKNNETRNLHITAEVFGIKTSAGGTATETVDVTVIRNPTGGTTISNANDVDIKSNRNYGSPKTLSADAYKGATGETMTGGEDHLLVISPDFSRVFASIDEIIPQGKTIGVKIKPPTSNTSMPVYVAAICHLNDANR